MSTEPWLEGPVDGIAPIYQPAAHALLNAMQDVERLAPSATAEILWRAPNGATPAGFHLLHLIGALDRLFTYARGESLDDVQKATARSETQAHPGLDGQVLTARVAQAIDLALDQLRRTDQATAFDAVRIGRAGLPSTVIGVLFHAAEHTARHAGQFITTMKLVGGGA